MGPILMPDAEAENRPGTTNPLPGVIPVGQHI
jgi:hypothetical protein